MGFQISGSIYDSIKSMKLNIQWQKRKANPFMEKGLDVDPQIVSLQKQAENVRKSNIICGIDGKLKSGQELTDSELEYLRNNSPELYKQAVEIKRERAEYQRELANCKTKEDVQRLNSQKLQRFLGEVNVIKSNANIPQGKKVELLEKIVRRVMGVQAEHMNFLKSKDYADLPREVELEEDKKEKKKAEVKESDDEISEISKELFDFLKSQEVEPSETQKDTAGTDVKKDEPIKDPTPDNVPSKGTKGTATTKNTPPAEKAVHIYNAQGSVKSAPLTDNIPKLGVTLSTKV